MNAKKVTLELCPHEVHLLREGLRAKMRQLNSRMWGCEDETWIKAEYDQAYTLLKQLFEAL